MKIPFYTVVKNLDGVSALAKLRAVDYDGKDIASSDDMANMADDLFDKNDSGIYAVVNNSAGEIVGICRIARGVPLSLDEVAGAMECIALMDNAFSFTALSISRSGKRKHDQPTAKFLMEVGNTFGFEMLDYIVSLDKDTYSYRTEDMENDLENN